MISEIVLFFANAFAGASTFVSQLVTSTGAEVFILSGIAIAFSVRFLLRPLSGSGAGSDSVKKRKKGE